MMNILDTLRTKNNRQSTKNNYFAVWRAFNKFVVSLDQKPDTWEMRVTLYATYLVHNGRQSSTVKSYISAIKSVLRDDGYNLNENKVVLHSLTRTCKLLNDKVHTRLPISLKLLKVMLFELTRFFSEQPYLKLLYRAVFSLAYYGMFRAGEIGLSDHTIKASNVHMGENKNKILVVLHSSKTHGAESRPQQVKITEKYSNDYLTSVQRYRVHRHFCPFTMLQDYLSIRGHYASIDEPLFIFRSGQPLQPQQIRKTLIGILNALDLDSSLYGVHSFRIGRCTDMFKWGCSIKFLKKVGRWHSSAIYRYLKS